MGKRVYDPVLDPPVKVDGYNIIDMKTKHWNFYVGGRKVPKKVVLEALRLKSNTIYAKWKHKY